MPILKDKGVTLSIKRIDQNHKHISGNKLYKLKYNLLEAKRLNLHTVLTFGGAYSNHIAATACLAKESKFKSIGIIRGEEYFPLNYTLKFAEKQGMEIHYLNRNKYKSKHTDSVIFELRQKFGDFYLIPEGGSNSLAIRGTSEIIDSNDVQDFICCPVGTGATIAGIISSTKHHQQVIGFPAIKGFRQLERDIAYWSNRSNWKLINDYVCGGYAKINIDLITTIETFYKIYNTPLDAIYTGKMMYGILDLVSKDYFPRGCSILAIHTGGIQGNKGMAQRLGIKLPS